MLTFAEEILILLLGDRDGELFTRVPGDNLSCALAGAVLLDLSFAGRIDTDPERLVVIDPTPTAVEARVFEYRSSHWCQSSGGTGQAAWAADTDTGILDEDLLELDLLWRYLRRRGISYVDERKDAEDAIEQALAQDGGMRTLKPEEPAVIGAFNLPEAGFGS